MRANYQGIPRRTAACVCRWISLRSLFLVREEVPSRKGLLQRAREVVTVGTTLVLSDLPVSPDTQGKPDFNILTASRPPDGTGQH